MSYLVKNSKNIEIHINFDMVSTRLKYFVKYNLLNIYMFIYSII